MPKRTLYLADAYWRLLEALAVVESKRRGRPSNASETVREAIVFLAEKYEHISPEVRKALAALEKGA